MIKYAYITLNKQTFVKHHKQTQNKLKHTQTQQQHTQHKQNNTQHQFKNTK